MKSITKKISKYNFSSRNGQSVKYIVMHFTGNKTDIALNNANYFGGGNRDASAHYFVDNTSIVQVVEENNASWHCGDGNGKYGITNQNSIGIEMCGTNGEIATATESNAIDLVKHLMTKYNIPMDRVVRHYDASRKVCPSPWSNSNWSKWNEFKNKIGKQSTSVTKEIYRIRKSWSDNESQKGAYIDLNNAKIECNKYKDYYVFNSKGEILYPIKEEIKEEVKVDYIIQYSNAIDQNIAEVMADRLNCPTINCLRPYAYYGQYKIVIAVGQARNKSGHTNVLIQGKDREETLDKAIAYCKSLGK